MSRHRLDLVFQANERPVGLWMGSSLPTEPQERALISTLLEISGAEGVYLGDEAQPLDAPVTYLAAPSDADWDEVREQWRHLLSGAWVVSVRGDWCVAWSDDDFVACGAAEHLVLPFREAWRQAFAPISVDDVHQIIALLERAPEPNMQHIKHYGSAITWAFPNGHVVRDAWDENPFVRRMTAGLSSWD